MIYTYSFEECNKRSLVGGKGLNLGKLYRTEGVNVPDGFCVSTNVFLELIKEAKVETLLKDLDSIRIEETDKIRDFSSNIRESIEKAILSKEIIDEIIKRIISLGSEEAYVIRSSATTEDSSFASFAGQQDSYLNVIGVDSILENLKKCFASVFSERAISYCIKNKIKSSSINMAVVIQKMISSEISGVAFTQDPTTNKENVVVINASFGMGEAIAEGLVTPDLYKIERNIIKEKLISTKKIAIYPKKNGGVFKKDIEEKKQVLSEAEILEINSIAKKIEDLFKEPQDIEWCIEDKKIYIVQSRPITTIYPTPKMDDNKKHLYISVAHQQMMTDAMKPLGLSLFRLTAVRPMYEAGGRLFVDIYDGLSSPKMRNLLIKNLGDSEPLIKDALQTIVNRGDFIENVEESYKEEPVKEIEYREFKPLINGDEELVLKLIEKTNNSIEVLKKDIQDKTGDELIKFIEDDINTLKKLITDKESSAIIMTGMNATNWLNEMIEMWLGEKNVADILSQSVKNNITSEMGISLMNISDMIRPHANIISFLENTKENNFLEGIEEFDDGKKIKLEISKYLNKYGMRCVGEIDITRTRWSENPNMLIPMILNNIRNFSKNEGKRKFDEGLERANNKKEDILRELRNLPEGEEKAREVEFVINLMRNIIGYREYPKYGIINRYFIYKKSLLKEANKLVSDKVIENKEDIYYLTFGQLKDVIKNKEVNKDIIKKAKEDYKKYEGLRVPRVMTSEGEIIEGKYKGKLSEKNIKGLSVSKGIVEGIAKIILDIKDLKIEKGDILITPFVDPSWTPAFIAASGIVTEVGGLMTHGAVIAREYGIPTIVSVENATKLIKNGQRICVNATEGYIDILE
ncbi:MAG: phosphoenolpyruvate synthase [Clostridium sp.]|uniref:phosphoenolpyruvate synthase n=1 Tax=Clostridium sp. TaxID=1506 RepID=UPI003EE536EF